MVEIGADEIMAMATAVVNRYYGGERAQRRDLIGESVAGVLKACANYREESGCSFSTFAYKCAKNEVAMYLRRERKWKEMLSEKDVDLEEVEAEGFMELFVSRPQENIEKLKGIVEMFKSDTDKAIVREILSGKKRALIAEDFGVSRQNVSRIFVKMKRIVRGKFKYEDGEVIER